MTKIARATAALFVVLLVLAAGCFSGGVSATTLSFSSNIPRDHEAQGNADCDQQTELSIQMSGLRAGSMRVRVFDGDGAAAFDRTYMGAEGGSEVRGLFGAAGSWTLQMDGSLVEGQASATLSCATA